jgi:serine/threonine protein kinase
MGVTTAPKPAAPPARLGRFELRRLLGKGAQATVWLAFDPRLEREVAVKLMRADAGAVAMDPWLHEARAVSRLTHPHIVPLFEADEQGGHPYLVFEYVHGPTLAERLRSHGAMNGREAAALMLGVLDALRAAHAGGLVHRDLKPSNILVDADGRARVMDFGIAARIADAASAAAGAGLIVGTPGYMSPEAACGAPAAPSMDVFAAGMMLGEMIAGQPLLRESDPLRAVRRIQREDMSLPADLGSRLDDGLRAIVMRALARDPAQRWPGAAEFHLALSQWLNPEPVNADAAPAAGAGTLEFLLRRMRHKTDFPALSDSVVRIQRVANSENESVSSLSNEILKDVALTNKLLRLVNTAHFSHAGGGSISTISRAVALIGFAGIRNMALSLVLLEHMHDKAHANQLKEEFLRALMAGTLAGELCSLARDSEEGFIGAMFQNLGRLLTEFYFPEEAEQIRVQLKPATGRPGEAAGEDAASQRVLGLSFEELGVGVARSWGLPESLQKAMRLPQGDPPGKLVERGPERVRWLGSVANGLTDAMLNETPERLPARIAELAARHARALGLGESDLKQAVQLARDKLSQLAQAMNLHVAPHSPSRRLLAAAGEPDSAAHDTLTPLQLQATMPAGVDVSLVADEPTLVLGPPPEKVAEMLAAGIQDITNTMVENFKLNEVLRMILETMFRALNFRRIVFCLRDPKTETLTGRFGLGETVESMAPGFRIPLKLKPGAVPDLFTAIALKGADTLISDATAGTIAARLPAWYREKVDAPAFLILPLMLKGAPFAMIYADKAQCGGIDLGEKELSLLRTLRNQAVMAFKQAS